MANVSSILASSNHDTAQEEDERERDRERQDLSTMERTLLGMAVLVLFLCVLTSNVSCRRRGKREIQGSQSHSIEFWTPKNEDPDGNLNEYEVAAKQFEKMKKKEGIDFKIKIVNVGWCCLFDALTDGALNGGLPDMMIVGSTWAALLADKGALHPLTDYFLRWSRLTRIDHTSGFSARVFYDYFFHGEWWVSPTEVGTRYLFYRKDVFKRVLGNKIAQRGPQTYDEMFDFAKKINETEPNMWGMVLPGGTTETQTAQTFMPFLHAYGGEFYDQDENCVLTDTDYDGVDNSFESAMEDYTRYYREGLSPAYDIPAGQHNSFFVWGKDEVSGYTGYAAMTIDYWAYANAIQEPWADGGKNIGYVALPKGPAGRFGFMGSQGLAISAESDKKESAWMFIQYLSDPDPKTGYMKQFCQNTFCIPARVEAMGTPAKNNDDGKFCQLEGLDTPFDELPIDPAVAYARFAVPLQYPQDVSPVVTFIDSQTLIPDQIHAVSRGDYSPAKAAQKICDTFDAQVSDYRAPTPYDTNTDLEDDFMIPMIVINSVLLALALVGAVSMVLLRDYAQIHFASWQFCVLIWLGCALGFVALYWWIIQPPEDWMCYCRMWFGPMAFTLVFAALTAKTYRINRLFHNKKFKHTHISNMDVAKWTIFLFIYPIIVLAVWSGVGDPRVGFVNVKDEDETHVRQCEYDHYWVFMGLLYGYIGVILFANCYMAFRTRNVNYHFNESKEIICAVYSVTVLAAVCLPLIHVFRELPVAAYVLTVVGAWCALMVFLLAMFASKLIPIVTGKAQRVGDVQNTTQTATRPWTEDDGMKRCSLDTMDTMDSMASSSRTFDMSEMDM